MISFDQFRAQTEGKQIDLDHYPVGQPYQCVDEASDYMELCLGGGRFTGNAKDIYGQESNLLNWEKGGVPPKGSVFVYGSSWGGGYGHVGTVISATPTTVTLLEQNVNGPRVTVGTHSRGGEIGYGVPKVNVNPTPVSSGGRYQAVRVCNVRVAPHVNAPLGGSQTLHVGDWFDASGVVAGDSVGGNSQWVHSLRGNYVWSGNLTKIG